MGLTATLSLKTPHVICHYTECRIFIVLLNVIVLSVVILMVALLSVVVMTVFALVSCYDIF